METQSRLLLIHVLTDLLPKTGAIVQAGNNWRFEKSVPELQFMQNRTYGTPIDIATAIADFYVEQVKRGAVRGVEFPRDENQSRTDSSRARSA